MKIPRILFGNYNTVLHNTSATMKMCKTNTDIKLNHLVLEKDMEDFRKESLIVLADDYITRSFNNSYFPGVFSAVVLQESTNDELKNDYLSSFDRDAWLLLTMLANNQITQFYYTRKICIKICEGLCRFWEDIISTGPVYFNFLEKNKGLPFWVDNLCFMKVLYKLGFPNDLIKNYNDPCFPKWYEKNCKLYQLEVSTYSKDGEK
jgi:hypothetical protein